jgi:hypothetical protein
VSGEVQVLDWSSRKGLNAPETDLGVAGVAVPAATCWRPVGWGSARGVREIERKWHVWDGEGCLGTRLQPLYGLHAAETRRGELVCLAPSLPSVRGKKRVRERGTRVS